MLNSKKVFLAVFVAGSLLCVCTAMAGVPWMNTEKPGTAQDQMSEDQRIGLCLDGAVRQIRSFDHGANHVKLSVSGLVARFSGNVLQQKYKDFLSEQATTCGATPDVKKLRVGR
ncbi:MAG TPA: hypothetical protein VJ723_14080 [Candidatus Angelobacter sp.]|nr:hypothetical protein [Candidatus Angelobacter sp.]